MKLAFDIIPRTLKFRFAAGTSRGVLREHNSYLIRLYHGNSEGFGEVAPLPGLSIDFKKDMRSDIERFANLLSSKDWSGVENPDDIFRIMDDMGLDKYPSVRFGLETALLDILNGGRKVVFESPFLKGEPIPINGLIWMGEQDVMLEQMQEKVKQQFRCVKMKVGAIELESEIELLRFIREKYSADVIELRLDANGAFEYQEVLSILRTLAEFDIHSIEQPIRQGAWDKMHYVCHKSPIPVALDEELIGIHGKQRKADLLDAIQPPYIILKPTLLGGFKECLEWISLARERDIGWWMTSALESNIGLNAIAQFASSLNVTMPQGLGTGSLYYNNIKSPLEVRGDTLVYNSETDWDI